MKRLLILTAICFTLAASFSSCKKCKKCHAEIMGIRGPEQELCGEQLDQAKRAGLVCE